MEERKQKEIEYYDKRAGKWLKNSSMKDWRGDFERFNPLLLSSYGFVYEWLASHCKDKKVLDYGCGNGIHSIFPAKNGAEVVGIDLSEESLKIARERVRREGPEGRITFFKMDCEKIDFPANVFDIVFNSGTFYTLDLKKAIPEIARVLKPDGILIGVETLGHNPITNLKRRINKLTGKRTALAVSNILKLEDLDYIKECFNKSEFHFFHIISWMAFPFLNLSAGQFLLKSFEVLDRILLRLPFLKKYAFKAVFVFSQPKK